MRSRRGPARFRSTYRGGKSHAAVLAENRRALDELAMLSGKAPLHDPGKRDAFDARELDERENSADAEDHAE